MNSSVFYPFSLQSQIIWNKIINEIKKTPAYSTQHEIGAVTAWHAAGVFKYLAYPIKTTGGEKKCHRKKCFAGQKAWKKLM